MFTRGSAETRSAVESHASQQAADASPSPSAATRPIAKPQTLTSAIETIRRERPEAAHRLVVAEFRDPKDLAPPSRVVLDEYRVFEREAALSTEQAKALREALADATLTFNLGLNLLNRPGNSGGWIS